MNWAGADQVIPSVSLALAVRVVRVPRGQALHRDRDGLVHQRRQRRHRDRRLAPVAVTAACASGQSCGGHEQHDQ